MQGPCYENQACIATHESNGLGIITALILNDINPLGRSRMDLVLELKNNASKLLLAIMESRSSSDSENVAEKIIYNLNPKQLVSIKLGLIMNCHAFLDVITIIVSSSMDVISILARSSLQSLSPRELGRRCRC